MLRVVHFEISADDAERASKFYANTFDWKVEKWEGGAEPYWMCHTGDDATARGIHGGIMIRNRELISSVANTIDVPSVDEYAEKVIKHGGQVVVPKFEIPGMGLMAYCKDTEDNVFGIWQTLEAGA